MIKGENQEEIEDNIEKFANMFPHKLHSLIDFCKSLRQLAEAKIHKEELLDLAA